MGEYKEFIISFYIAAIIPIVYMIVYLLKGKKRSVGNFFMVLFDSLALYFSAIIPILLMVAGWSNMENGDLVAIGVIDTFALIFSIPFLTGLVKDIERDFEVSDNFKKDITNLIIGIIITIFFIAALIGATAGFVSGEVSIEALFAILCMFVMVVAILIFSRYKTKFAENPEMIEKVKISERKFGITLMVCMFIFFIFVSIF